MDSTRFGIKPSSGQDKSQTQTKGACLQYWYDGFVIQQAGSYLGMDASYNFPRTITESRQARLYHLAHYDNLTDLPNRLLFEDRLRQALAQARCSGHLVAVMFLDFDCFKTINDSFGHAVGDALLKTIAERLTRNIRESDTAARLGGDEFILICSDIRQPQDAAQIAQLVLEAVAKPYMLEGHEVHISASIGITLYPLDDSLGDGDKNKNDIQALLKNADIAMYKAKKQGKNTYQFYTAEMNVATLERRLLGDDLRKALENQEFILHYQPRMLCADNTVTGMEALIRWRHPTLGIISPEKFIPLAEETGLILPIGEWVLRTACTQNKTWIDAGMAPLRVAVNLSAQQFKHPNLLGVVGNILCDTGLPPNYLELELTESLAMEDVQKSVITLNALGMMGISVAIDDFGTGYSSLAYLNRFPVDFLKIDKSFVHDLGSSHDNEVIAKTVIAMAHNLQLQVVGEGVETRARLDFLRQHGCEEMQGYFLSLPLPADKFSAFIQAAKISNLATASSIIPDDLLPEFVV